MNDNNKRFYPVIHCLTPAQTLANVGIALTNGAHGVFLIGHNMVNETLLRFYREVRSVYGEGIWVGINFLDLDPVMALKKLPDTAQALWTDNPGIYRYTQKPRTLADEFNETRELLGKKFEYFGGVAFKGQPPQDLMRETLFSINYVDVTTTSGPETGFPPTPEKIRTMREYLNEFRDRKLAVASGITEQNVRQFLPYADYFLVASGISTDFHHLNMYQTALLSRMVREWRP